MKRLGSLFLTIFVFGLAFIKCADCDTSADCANGEACDDGQCQEMDTSYLGPEPDDFSDWEWPDGWHPSDPPDPDTGNDQDTETEIIPDIPPFPWEVVRSTFLPAGDGLLTISLTESHPELYDSDVVVIEKIRLPYVEFYYPEYSQWVFFEFDVDIESLPDGEYWVNAILYQTEGSINDLQLSPGDMVGAEVVYIENGSTDFWGYVLLDTEVP